MTREERPVWLVTGCSTGFGREIALLALEEGKRVVATARDKKRVADVVDGFADSALALDLDVTNAEQVKAAVSQAEARFGRIDVLVNNAGYGYQAAAEEGEEDEIRALFEANVFGLFAMTRAVLPGMRKRRSGYIVNITSLAGLSGFASSAYYAASKHAVEGFSDSLAAETEPLGIHVTCVEPGPFRTDWAGRSLRQTPVGIADYEATVAARMKGTADSSGRQPGDPRRAARLIVELADQEKPPRNIALGARAVELGSKRLNAKLSDIAAWREKALATDAPA